MQKLMSVLIFLTASCGAQNAASRTVRADASGTQRVTVTFDGRQREYFVQSATRARGLSPVVFVLHGGTRSADDILSRSSWPSVAAREGAILIVPSAIEGNWNDGRSAYLGRSNPSGIDDVGFLRRLIAIAVREHGADPSRVYFTGASNGGNMSWRMACEANNQVTAIAPLISTMASDPARSCAAARPTPVIAFFGTEDRLMRYDGSASSLGRRTMEARSSAPESTAFWARVNGCSGRTREDQMPDLSRADQTSVTRIGYQDCPRGKEVVRYDVIGGGHQQPGNAVPRRFGRLLGRGNQDIDSVELSWAFFKRQAR